MSKIGVIGSGTWGTALAVLLTGNGHEVELWSAVPAEVEALTATRRHPNLGDTPIPEKIRVTGDLEQAMKDKELLVLGSIGLCEGNGAQDGSLFKGRAGHYQCSQGD